MRGWQRWVVAALLAGIGAVPSSAVAQGQPGGGGPGADVTLSPAEAVFPSPTDLDFNAGWVDQGGVSVTVEPKNRNRQNWQLFIQASAADMGGYGKPVSDILVRAEGASTWTPLGTTATLVAEGTGATTVTLFFRLLLDWGLDAPGAYSVPLEYTASTF